MTNEPELVEWLRREAGRSGAIEGALNPLTEERGSARGGRGVVLGIGDDCAVFRPKAGEDLIFTTDQLIENVHFTTSLKAAAIGERALARSLSDIAAMGGEPRFCLVSLAIPAATDDLWIKTFFRGLLKLARKHETVLAGGDLSQDDKIHADVMVCGAVPRGKALRRDRAKAGDEIYVSGRLGKGWNRPILPRLALGQQLLGVATSCIDLSDGLSLDLHRVCVASGVAADLEGIPIATGSTLEKALHLGEDYELLFTLPFGTSPFRETTRIGSIVRGTPGQVRFKGQPLESRGFDHFKAT